MFLNLLTGHLQLQTWSMTPFYIIFEVVDFLILGKMFFNFFDFHFEMLRCDDKFRHTGHLY